MVVLNKTSLDLKLISIEKLLALVNQVIEDAEKSSPSQVQKETIASPTYIISDRKLYSVLASLYGHANGVVSDF